MKMKCLLLAGFLMISAFPQTGNAYTLRPADIVNETPDWDVCPDSFSIFIFDAPDLRDRSNPNPLPELATMFLLGSALVALAAFKRRKVR